MNVLISIFVFIFGIIVGSFLNVLIYRLPRNINFTKGYSMCPKCEHRLYPLDLIPVFSWLFLGRKCRYCNEPISPIYPFVELLNGILWLLMYTGCGLTLDFIANIIILSCLTVVIFTDWQEMIIPDSMNIIIFLAGILLIWGNSTLSLTDRIIGFFAISVPMLLLVIITRGAAMGGGDIKLMAALGFCVGWKEALFITIGGAVLGSIAYLVLLKTKSKLGKQVPYGTFLAITAIISLFYGNEIIYWYFSLI